MAVITEAETAIDLVHIGPGTLAGRYLRMFWQPIYRGEDLAAGRAVPVKLLGEQFTLYRGETGSAHLVAHRCAHRGTQLSVGWVEDDCIRCRYHGWRYESSGQCVEQPGEDPSFAQRIAIKSYPVEEYLGLIFVYLGDGLPPPMRRYPEFEREPVLETYAPDFWPCNYFNRLDNFCDLGHVAFTHQESNRRRRAPSMTVPHITSVETDYGIYTISDAPGQRAQASFVDMPNTNHLPRNVTGGRPGDRLFFRVPVDDEHTVSFAVERTHLEGEAARLYTERRREAQKAPITSTENVGLDVLAGRLGIEEIDTHTILSGSGYTDIFWTEDYVCQVGQGAVADRPAERLGRVDAGVVLFRQVWRRELRALAEGRPLKEWTCSSGLGDEPPV